MLFQYPMNRGRYFSQLQMFSSLWNCDTGSKETFFRLLVFIDKFNRNSWLIDIILNSESIKFKKIYIIIHAFKTTKKMKPKECSTAKIWLGNRWWDIRNLSAELNRGLRFLNCAPLSPPRSNKVQAINPFPSLQIPSSSWNFPFIIKHMNCLEKNIAILTKW